LKAGFTKAPAECRVLELRGARESAVRLAHHERRPSHAFDATGDAELDVSGADRSRDGRRRIEARAAQPVDRRTADASGNPASSTAMRATLRLSSPAWLAQP
jgi:hypothetical protein